MVEPSHWELRSWQRKILGDLQLQESGDLQEHLGADSMIVAMVTTSEQRLQNLKKASERTDADHSFWFTTIEELNAEAILTERAQSQIYGFNRFGHKCGYRLAEFALFRCEMSTIHLEMGELCFKRQPIRADRENGIAPD